MRPVELNLATRPFRNDAPVGVVLGVFAVAAVAFTAYNAQAYLTADARESALREELSDHRARMERLSVEAREIDAELAGIDVATLESQASFVASVMQERNFSWTRLFNELERVVPWNVRLSSIRPEFAPGSINLSILGTAKDVGAFFDFQETLEGSENFSNVLPTQWEHQEGTPDVSFTLLAVYRPRAAPDPAGAEAARASSGGAASTRTAAGGTEPAARVVVEDADEPPAAAPAPEPAPVADAPPSQPPRRRRASPSAGEQAAAPGTGRGDGAAPAPAGTAAPAPAGDDAAAGESGSGSATSDFAGTTGAIRTRGAPAPDQGVRTVTRPGDTPRPAYDANNPRNPPEIVYDERGNPVAIAPRVSPNADPTRVPPTGRAPDLPDPEGGAEADPPADGTSGSGDDGGTPGDTGSGGGGSA